MSTIDLESRTRERVQAWNRHDPEVYASYYAEDALVHDPQYPEPLRGRDAVRKDFEAYLTTFPDARFTLRTVMATDDTVAFELVASGTHRGPLPGPSGPVPATGRTVEMAVAAFSRVDGRGLVVEERRYFDVAALMDQLGLLAA
jgi:steroid delta-isomerase-like uncharacterized protein